MDHYDELVLAGVERWGISYLNALDLQIVADASARGFEPFDVPKELDTEATGEWRPTHVHGGRIRWSRECEACEGSGDLYAQGANGKDYRMDCPECDGGGFGDYTGDIVTDWAGRYLRQADE